MFFILSLCPGTTERVCLIQGTVEALNGVHDFIAEKVREMPQSTQKTEPVSILQPQTTVNPDRVKQVSGSLVCLCVFFCLGGFSFEGEKREKEVKILRVRNQSVSMLYVCLC